MQASESSANFLSRNWARLKSAVPKAAIDARLPISTQRTVLKGLKSARLETLDKIAELLDTPSWLLIHPDMERWDKERLWILRITEAYLAADETGKELIRSAVRNLDRQREVTSGAAGGKK